MRVAVLEPVVVWLVVAAAAVYCRSEMLFLGDFFVVPEPATSTIEKKCDGQPNALHVFVSRVSGSNNNKL